MQREKEKAVESAEAMRAENLAEKERLRAATVAKATKRREQLELNANLLTGRALREGLLSKSRRLRRLLKRIRNVPDGEGNEVPRQRFKKNSAFIDRVFHVYRKQSLFYCIHPFERPFSATSLPFSNACRG